MAGDDQYPGAEDTTLTVSAPGVLDNDSDPDGEALTAILVSDATSGSVTLNASGSFTYLPASDFHGTDSFTYKAHDGTSDSNVATVTITVSPVNDAPVADNQSVMTDEDVSVAITLTGSDIDGDGLTYQIIGGPAHGSLSGTVPHLTYTPAAGFTGADSFSFEVYDGNLHSASATVSITVNAVNNAPTAYDDSYSLDQDTMLSVPALGVVTNDSDPDGDELTAVVEVDPSHGVLTLNSDGSFDYMPHAGFFGADSFTYRAYDGTVAGNEATVTLAVNEVSTGPNLAHGVVANVGSSWQTVVLSSSYDSMVVVATHPRTRIR